MDARRIHTQNNWMQNTKLPIEPLLFLFPSKSQLNKSGFVIKFCNDLSKIERPRIPQLSINPLLKDSKGRHT